MKLCLNCGKELQKQQRKYCCKSCIDAYYYRTVVKLIRQTRVCTICGKERSLVLKGITKRNVCSSCSIKQVDKSGPNNGRWLGGTSKYAVNGRFGKDKDGLSWKKQRQLAWERDNKTCRHCGKKTKRAPDVHHIVPYVVSKSHALSNLICLCHPCHIQEEKNFWKANR